MTVWRFTALVPAKRCTTKSGGNRMTKYELKPNEYESIGTPEYVVNWIHNRVTLTFRAQPKSCFNLNHVYCNTHARFIDAEINRLLSVGVIELVEKRPHCVLSMRAVPKKNKKFRLVVDCHHVNESIECPTFSQEGISAVAESIESGDILLTLDLKDGFHHVPLNKAFQTFLGIAWHGKFYVWKVLCFRVSIAPYYFNKIVCPVICYLRSVGVRLASFVDDFLLMLRRLLLQQQLESTIQTFTGLGWTINYEKCDLEPTTQTTFVGFIIKSETDKGLWIKVLPAKIRKLYRSIVQILHSASLTACSLAKVAGQCVSMTKAIVLGKLLLRNIYRVIASRDNWDTCVKLDAPAIKDLQWWLSPLKGWNGAPLIQSPVQIQVMTDVASSGWGGTTGTIQAAGLWNKRVSCMHSNFRELLAVYQTIRSLHHCLRDKHVQILSDNVTTVAYINHLKGNVPVMYNLMQTIWSTAQQHGITLSARHLAGLWNGEADRLSRISSPYNWHLHPKVFKTLDTMWGPHTVDRFAAQHNTHLSVYNSLYWDPETKGVDALAQGDWSSNNFVNPPFWLLSRIMDKIKQEEAHATVIAPLWEGQRWFQKMSSMVVMEPFQIQKSVCL